MEGYESPITQIIDKVMQEAVMQEEANLMFTVRQSIGYAIDKEELIKALQYDRKQYEKGYEDGRKANRWIPADKELPEDGEMVLCWYEYFRFGDYNRMYQTFGIGYQYDGRWGGEATKGVKAKVLYWMELPEPPEGAEIDE